MFVKFGLNTLKKHFNNMNKSIVVTGTLGFIGKVMVEYLNNNGFSNIIEVDKHNMHTFLDNYKIDAIIHLGACTNTMEFDYEIHKKLNVEYPKILWEYATKHNIPLIYASSAATYGDGTYGYDDSHTMSYKIQPLNPYGVSKNEFDKWVIGQTNKPPVWSGLKFFNVYGHNESHKGKMASMVYHSYHQIKENGKVKLFKSYKYEYKDGGQLRDFIYVKDVVEIIFWMLNSMLDSNWDSGKNGLYNVGTGKTESFLNLANYVFKAMQLEPSIEFINMPTDIHSKYQYYTKANNMKLFLAGYEKQFTSLEDGIKDYVVNYLQKNN